VRLDALAKDLAAAAAGLIGVVVFVVLVVAILAGTAASAVGADHGQRQTLVEAVDELVADPHGLNQLGACGAAYAGRHSVPLVTCASRPSASVRGR